MSCPYVSRKEYLSTRQASSPVWRPSAAFDARHANVQLSPVRLSVRTLFDALSVTKDRVIDCIIDHPTIVVRETHYWRCPVCNAVAGQESMRCAEAIEQISSSA